MIEQLPSPMNDPQPTGAAGGTQKIVSDYAVANLVVEVVPVKVVNWPSMFGKGPPALPSSATRGLGSGQSSQTDATFVRVINSEPIKVTLTKSEQSGGIGGMFGKPQTDQGDKFSAFNKSLTGPSNRQSILGNNSGLNGGFTGGNRSGSDAVIKGLGNSVKSQTGALSNLSKTFSSGGGLGAEVGGLARAAGALAPAALALAPVVAGLQAVVAPMVGAVKGGIESGIQRGAGTAILGKSAEALGVAIGVTMLPAVIKVSGALMGLADFYSNRLSPVLDKWSSRLGWLIGSTGKDGEEKKGILATGQEFGEKIVKTLNPVSWFGQVGNKISGALGLDKNLFPTTPVEVITGESSETIRGDLSRSNKKGDALANAALQASVTPQASYQGITDVRQQAQLAALNEDPLEKEMKQYIREGMKKIPGILDEINKNTKPQGTA